MATDERELTQPVDLCTPNGKRLNRAARGWSRVPLHRANLRGRRFRTKRWDYWAILTGDLAISATYADVGYVGIVSVWWADLPSGRRGGREVTVPLGRKVNLPELPGGAPLRFEHPYLQLELVDEPHASRIFASWRERDGGEGRLDATIDLPEGHESLNVVIPWTGRRFQYTSKHQARPARGTLIVGSDRASFGDEHGDAWGVLDVGRGRWPYRTRWNWAAGAGRATNTGAVIGLQLGGRWTVGTGFTENGILVDGRLTKIGEELTWDYSWRAPLRRWRIRDAAGRVDLLLEPRLDRHARTSAVLLATEVHQVFGPWSGTVVSDDGVAHSLVELPGFAEESRARW